MMAPLPSYKPELRERLLGSSPKELFAVTGALCPASPSARASKIATFKDLIMRMIVFARCNLVLIGPDCGIEPPNTRGSVHVGKHFEQIARSLLEDLSDAVNSSFKTALAIAWLYRHALVHD
jgi:hypothetical protein